MLISEAGNSCALCPDEVPQGHQGSQGQQCPHRGAAGRGTAERFRVITHTASTGSGLPASGLLPLMGVLGLGLVGSKAGGLEERAQSRGLEQLSWDGKNVHGGRPSRGSGPVPCFARDVSFLEALASSTLTC